MAENKEESYKIGFSVWLTLCIVLCIWFLSSFIKGRRQFQTNLHVIEEGLRRMQEEMEFRERQRSMSYGEDIQEITDLIKNINNPESNDEFPPISTKPLNLYVLIDKMRRQKVVIDVWKMVFSSCSYLALAFVAYVLLKLLYACFWFPAYLQKEDERQLVENCEKMQEGNKPEEVDDKKNI